MKICFSFRCNSYGSWTPTKCDSILILHLFTTKFVAVLLTLTQKCHISDFKRTKSKTLRTASTGRMTNWKKPPRDPVQIIRTKDWYFKSLIIVNTATCYFFTNLQVIYFWNGHRERRSSHWHLQLHTRSAERYRWRYSDLHSDAIMLSLIQGPPTHLIGKILGRCTCKYISDKTHEHCSYRQKPCGQTKERHTHLSFQS